MYTSEQYEYMLKCREGLLWHWHQDTNADEVLRYLMDNGIVIARADKHEDLYELSQKGKAVLESHEKIQQKEHDAEHQRKNDAVQAKKNTAKEMHNNFIVTIFAHILEKLPVYVELAKKFIGSLR